MSAAFPSRHRSRIALERSRDVNNSIISVASSTGSNHGTVSTDSTTSTDFDPIRDEACMSTQQINANYSQKLPELRDTAKKYGRWQPRSQPEYVINTSAIGQAFPDFSQIASSDDTFNVEVGRGTGQNDRNPNLEYSGSPSSPVITLGTTKILHTPKRTNSNHSLLQNALHNMSSKEAAQHNTEEKENIPRSRSSVKGSPYISRASHTVSGERRNLADLHARVADESDGSFIGQERPNISALQPPKNSRFSNGQTRNQQRVSASPNVSSKRQPSEVVDEAKAKGTSNTPYKLQERSQLRPRHTTNTTNSLTPNPTQQSFLLPSMRGTSDVDSGTLNNVAPASTQNGKAHNLHSYKSSLSNVSFGPIWGVMVPEEEEDIYELIKLLKGRISRVEAENADQKQIISDITRSNNQLALEKKALEEFARSDTALKTDDSGSERHKGSRAEILKLQARIISIQNQLDTSEQRLSDQDMLINTSTTERDQAVKQLAQAYLQSERLRDENDCLRQERENLLQELQRAHDQISSLKNGHQPLEQLDSENRLLKREIKELKGSAQKPVKQLESENRSLRQENEALKKSVQVESKSQEQANIWRKNEAKLCSKLYRQEEVIRRLQEITQEMHENTREINLAPNHRNGSKPKSRRKSLPLDPSQGLTSNLAKRGQEKTDIIDSANTGSRGRDKIRDDSNMGRDDINIVQETANSHQDTALRILGTLNNDTTFDIDGSNSTTTHKDIENNPREDTAEGSSYASILGQGFMATLRQHVQTLRDVKEQQQRQLDATARSIPDDTAQSNYPAQISRPHSSHEPVGILKNASNKNREELTGRLSIKSANSNYQHAKDLTGRLSVKSAQSGKSLSRQDKDRSSASHRRHHSETSIHTSHRRRMENDDMTSAFIIPDLEFGAQRGNKEHPKFAPEARRVLNGLCKHKSNNCIVCRQVASYSDNNTTNGTKQTIHIEKPVPVSERMPIPGPHEDEPTIRPSVLPSLALATVIKGLQDEIAHLKMKHAEIQAAYNRHDSSLGMRTRKTMKKKLDDFLSQIDHKSDQVYALYDVLEGQKQSGQVMSETEVEKTLSNIGIDQDTNKEGEDEQDDTLPWEGIEDD